MQQLEENNFEFPDAQERFINYVSFEEQLNNDIQNVCIDLLSPSEVQESTIRTPVKAENTREIISSLLEEIINESIETFEENQKIKEFASRYETVKDNFMNRKLRDIQNMVYCSFGNESLNPVKKLSKLEKEKEFLKNQKESQEIVITISNEKKDKIKENNKVNNISLFDTLIKHKSKLEIEKELIMKAKNESSNEKNSFLNRKTRHCTPEQQFDDLSTVLSASIKRKSPLQMEKEKFLEESKKKKELEMKEKSKELKTSVFKLDCVELSDKVSVEKEMKGLDLNGIDNIVKECYLCKELVGFSKSNKEYPLCKHSVHSVITINLEMLVKVKVV